MCFPTLQAASRSALLRWARSSNAFGVRGWLSAAGHAACETPCYAVRPVSPGVTPLETRTGPRHCTWLTKPCRLRPHRGHVSGATVALGWVGVKRRLWASAGDDDQLAVALAGDQLLHRFAGTREGEGRADQRVEGAGGGEGDEFLDFGAGAHGRSEDAGVAPEDAVELGGGV